MAATEPESAIATGTAASAGVSGRAVVREEARLVHVAAKTMLPLARSTQLTGHTRVPPTESLASSPVSVIRR